MCSYNLNLISVRVKVSFDVDCDKNNYKSSHLHKFLKNDFSRKILLQKIVNMHDFDAHLYFVGFKKYVELGPKRLTTPFFKNLYHWKFHAAHATYKLSLLVIANVNLM